MPGTEPGTFSMCSANGLQLFPFNVTSKTAIVFMSATFLQDYIKLHWYEWVGISVKWRWSMSSGLDLKFLWGRDTISQCVFLGFGEGMLCRATSRGGHSHSSFQRPALWYITKMYWNYEIVLYRFGPLVHLNQGCRVQPSSRRCC